MTFGRDDHVALVAGGLGVVALNPAAHAMHQLGIRISEVHLARRRRRRLARVGRAPEAATVLHQPLLAVNLVLRVGITLGSELFLQSTLALTEPLRT